MRKLLTSLLTLLFLSDASAQETFPASGLSDKRAITYAFTNARIYIDYKTVIDNGTLIIRKNKIITAGKDVAVPANAVVADLKGKYIYPSFIDIYSDYGLPANKARETKSGRPQYNSAVPGAYNWNQAVMPEYEAYRAFTADEDKSADLRKYGFGTVMSLRKDGIFRGTAVLAALSSGNDQEVILTGNAAACHSFDKGSSTQACPTSLMGSIALVRQTLYDARWYEQAKRDEYNISLESLNAQKSLPQIFEAGDYLNAQRIEAIGKEFGVHYIIKGGGDEYKNIPALKQAGSAFIIPMKFPDPYDVTDPYDALNIPLEQLRHWEMAPSNAAMLEKAGIEFAFTADGIKDRKDIYKNLRLAVEAGLSRQTALKALTFTPAALLNFSDSLGSIRPGMLASFIITEKDLFDKDNVILENWVLGKRYIINNSTVPDLRGYYTLTVDSMPLKLKVTGERYGHDYSVEQDTLKQKATMTFTGNLFVLSFELRKGVKGIYRLNGEADSSGLTQGSGIGPDGSSLRWAAMRDSAFKPPADTSREEYSSGTLWHPNTAYGSEEIPHAKTILIKNATVWTNEKEGVVATDVLIANGRIEGVGKNLSAAGAEVIDGAGMHVTPGIIDEHSHIAVSGSVNEASQSNTAEVRIGDVIDPDDINIYRQLAGGVTSSQILHGSANAIGGQAQLIKLRWGRSAEEMKFEGAPPFIKFALGENVKQSNWGDDNSIRYPQTRMGVEQIYIDAFTRARQYESEWKSFNASKSKNKVQPRKDLELDAIAEILNAKRFITCHSYVQSEINMLMKVADSFGIKVNTFTHILEGYKVADKMKAHGAAASTFSDWWAYKYEVMEAIPYNAAILNKMHVPVAINSDDAEMARRLNQEAAKTMKYGGVPAEEAMKMVTLYPAMMLHIDNRTGSIRKGKDADLVLWSGDPLSVYSRPLKTFVDGIAYFDADRDMQLRQQNEKERNRIIQKMILEKMKGTKTAKAPAPKKLIHNCED